MHRNGSAAIGSLCITGFGDHHDVALHRIFHRGGVAAVVRVAAYEQVAAAAEADGQGGVAVKVAEGDLGLIGLALAQQGQVQGVEFLLVCSTTVLMPLAISLRISPTVARKVAMSSGTERVITRPSCVAV